MPIRTILKSALYSPCNLLVNSDGTLTYEGNRAVTCISNGATLAAAAGFNSISIDLISRALQYLEELTGCGGIVNWNMVNRIGNVATILNIIPREAAENNVICYEHTFEQPLIENSSRANIVLYNIAYESL
jgi:hypothetical protein